MEDYADGELEQLFGVRFDAQHSNACVVAPDLNFDQLAQMAGISRESLLQDEPAMAEALPKLQALSMAEVEDVCDRFVEGFLKEGKCVTSLHDGLRECDSHLEQLEATLRTFLERLLAVREEIGNLKRRAETVAVELQNKKYSESVLHYALSQLTVPPDVVQVIINSNDETLGPQFSLALRQLHRTLRFRKKRFCAGAVSSGASTAKPDLIAVATPASSTGCTTPPPGLTSPTDPLAALEWSRTAVFAETCAVINHLSLFAAAKVKNYLVEKMSILNKKGTNIAIQQYNVLRPLRHFVRFLKELPQLLHDTASNNHKAVAEALYLHVKTHYVSMMSRTYHDKFFRYLSSVNALEAPPVTCGVVPHKAQPVLTDFATTVTEDSFTLKPRDAVFERLEAPPIVPYVQRQLKKQHPFEETFRSINVLLCDVTTSEFLFTFEFFVSDSTIYQDVLQDTVQLVVDYLAQVVLGAPQGAVTGPKHQFTHFIFSDTSRDYCGLLILIRLAHLFKLHMKRVRKLTCLGSYFDSLLLLLWPAFKRALDLQLQPLRELTKEAAQRFLCNLTRFQDRISAVHPIVKRYAATACSLMLLGQTLGPSFVEAQLSLGSSTHSNRASPEQDATNDEDYADCSNRFQVLRANLSFLRVEMQKVVGYICEADGKPTSAPAVNNYNYIVSAWSTAVPLAVSPTFSPLGVEVAASCIPDDPDALHGSGSAKRSDTLSEPSRDRFASGDSYSLMAMYDDFRAVEAELKAARARFAEEALEQCFPQLCAFMKKASENPRNLPLTPQLIAQLGVTSKALATTWEQQLEQLQQYVRTCIADPKTAVEALKQSVTQLLLYNTRLHSYIGQYLGSHSNIRSLMVSSQQLLQKLRAGSKGRAQPPAPHTSAVEEPVKLDLDEDALYDML